MSNSVNYLVARQPLQSGTVGRPVGVGTGGDAPISVHVYAFGVGVTLVGQRSDLPRTEGAFELEAHGKVFVFDEVHGAVVEAYRLVAPVERHVAAIRHAVEAVDQDELAKFGFGIGHGLVPPEKTAILSLPQGMGKGILAHRLAARIGCSFVVDEWLTCQPMVHGALHLTSDEVAL